MLALSKPSVRVNNEAIAISPNSCKVGDGEGETTVRTQSGGGNSVELVITDDASQKIGTVMFDMLNTIKNIKLAKGWKKNPGKNVVSVSGELDGEVFSQTYRIASITNKVEWGLAADGNTSLEWSGAQPV
jgi:hypothetical protein